MLTDVSFFSLASIVILFGISELPNNEVLQSKSSKFESNCDSIKGNDWVDNF